ncbi:cytidylate kinase [Chloroherpeton thalassium ATCC 35110]|uniref:Cytidylate kinase n=1 Tax=Chloroherpeton thalassium (strain ATCC 35110 / GB-78) TaxID=517418 RepID=KCY_CHLT3|nr:(d)CMP kinase [Chloroherpeton thalassium]B3QSU1.1 RecName: Full=Cytidylate kinase; Short=CK; AltName: Full=Cytidine monophosphate kinase; Short=CMP kinase [Chloroherpeton thalassium ATCC 35110]ACF12584.1 cytidylate kinase [Chloroherpeton thalassium ATCC 35110]
MPEATLTKKIIIAIDGPAASGKSTTAKQLAQKLSYTYIDTGAMYRAVTLKVLRDAFFEKIFSDELFLKKLLSETEVILKGEKVFLDGEEVTKDIRTNEVSSKVSKVSSLPLVREKLVEYQRNMGKARGVVMDGRDIGTIVFPDAELKVFMIADAKERAKRRYAELKAKSPSGDPGVTLETLEQEILQRDEDDRTRAIAPLRKPDDARELDTSKMTIEEQVAAIYELATDVISQLK